MMMNLGGTMENIDFIKNIPVPLLYGRVVKYKDKIVDYIVEFGNKKLLEIFKKYIDNITNKSIKEILPVFKLEKYFNDIFSNKFEKCFKRYIPELKGWFKIEKQKVNDEQYILYFDEVIKYKDTMLEKVKQSDKILFIKDGDGLYLDCNEAFEKIARCSADNIFGMNDIEIWGEKIGKSFIESHEESVRNKEKYSKKICNFFNVCYSIGRYLFYDEDDIITIFGICEEVSDIRKEKEKIENTKKMMEIIKDAIPDNIYYRDINGRYLECNNSFLDDLGLKREEVIGKNNNEISKLEHLADIYKITDDEVINCREKRVYEEELIIDNKAKYVETIKTPLFDHYNNIIGIIGISRDISHRKEMEEEIDRLRLEFFANLSHELRTPINLIFSALQLVRLKEKDTLQNNEMLDRYLRIINQNGNRLLKLVNNLIDLTKIDCGYFEYKPQNEDIVSFVEDICMSVADFSKQNDIDLIFDTNIEEMVMAFDPEKLERIMLNLLSNSIKYNQKPGLIEINLKYYDDIFEIRVKDTGIGIPEDKKNDVFDKFKQLDNRLRKVSEGSGIGLSLAKSLVEIQGGTINVESKLGVGSEFIVKLPLKVVDNDEHDFIYERKINSELVERVNIEFSDIY